MIQIETLHVEEFRGIRELDLNLACKSFVVCGPNGSGKSGVVDAIGFVLTGSIPRLSGPGTGGVSLLKHGPHVHRRDNAGAAKVTIGIRDPTSGQTGTLSRTVKKPAEFDLAPDTPELRAAVAQAQAHPELTLSRREIMKFVVAESGKRAQEVQALLQLDRIDEMRRLLITARNKCANERSAASGELIKAEESMCRHLDLPSLLTSEIAREINKRREALGLLSLTAVTIGTELLADSGDVSVISTFNKASAVRDAKALAAAATGRIALREAVDELTGALDQLAADPDILTALHHRSLVEAGLGLVAQPVCPLCDATWGDIESLKAHLKAKLDRSAAAADLQDRLLAAASKVQTQLGIVTDLVRDATSLARDYGGADLPEHLEAWSSELIALANDLSTVDGTVRHQDRLSSGILNTPTEVSEGLSALVASLQAQPDQSVSAEARAYLTVAQERWIRLRQARASDAQAGAAHAVARAVYESYCAAADEALAKLYKTVEEDFSAYYRHLNADDESSFTATLEPSAGKLDLSVAFYSTGMFPPAAYHSEGHQDGMGVCLYLALVRQLLGKDFRFAVLDDVVMSIDRDHRRQFCSLLKETFSDVQFIITTHDDVWARQMQASGLISSKAQARFHGWSVDGGPVYEQGNDIWSRITTALAEDDVPSAAHKLRRYLEATASDLAERLHASVVYRSDGAHDLGDLLAAVKGRHRTLLRKAAASAAAWKNADLTKRVNQLKDERAKVVPEQEGESWAINKLVHNTDWATLGQSDFAPVMDTTKRFLALFSCGNPECGSLLYVTGQFGHEEELRCSCGLYNLNLRSKP